MATQRDDDRADAAFPQQQAAGGGPAQFGGGTGDGTAQQSQRGSASNSGGGDGPSAVLRSAAGDLKQEGKKLAQHAGEQVEQLAQSQKARASDYVRTVSNALQASAAALRNDGFDGSAGAIERIADDIGEFARTLSTRNPRDLLSDMNGFAREKPALFLGASLFAGFGAARVLKSGMTAGQQATGDTRNE
jgi:hypothetical protein